MKIDKPIKYKFDSEDNYFAATIDGHIVNVYLDRDTKMSIFLLGYVLVDNQMPTEEITLLPDPNNRYTPDHPLTIKGYIKAPNLAKLMQDFPYRGLESFSITEKQLKEMWKNKTVYTFSDEIYDKYFPDGEA